ncbi:unnamed protein product, partial [marine sediment metagenome]
NQLKIENLNIKLFRAENIIFKKGHTKESISSYDACLISAMTMEKYIEAWSWCLLLYVHDLRSYHAYKLSVNR